MTDYSWQTARMFATIDPGSEGSGLAVWDKANFPALQTPIYSEVMVPPSDMRWADKVDRICNRFEEVFSHLPSHMTVVLEYPMHFGSAGGIASQESGAFVKLCFIAGAIHRVLRDRKHEVTLITTQDWKGQLPKNVVISRIKEILGVENCAGFVSHVWDAVGLGLYITGNFQ